MFPDLHNKTKHGHLRMRPIHLKTSHSDEKIFISLRQPLIPIRIPIDMRDLWVPKTLRAFGDRIRQHRNLPY